MVNKIDTKSVERDSTLIRIGTDTHKLITEKAKQKGVTMRALVEAYLASAMKENISLIAYFEEKYGNPQQTLFAEGVKMKD